MSDLFFNCNFQNLNTNEISGHGPPFHFCKKCSVTLCTPCLIPHIIHQQEIHKDTKEIIDLRNASSHFQHLLETLSAKLNDKYKDYLNRGINDNDKFKEILSLLDTMDKVKDVISSIINDIKNSIVSMYMEMKKDTQEQTNNNLRNKTQEEYDDICYNLGVLSSKLHSRTDGTQLIKEYYLYETKTEEFIKSFLESNNSKEQTQKISIEDTIKKISALNIKNEINEITSKLSNINNQLNIISHSKYPNMETIDKSRNIPLSDPTLKTFSSMTQQTATNINNPNTNFYLFPQKEEFIYPYTSKLYLCLKSANSKPGEIVYYDSNTNKILSQTLILQHFYKCYSKFFPYKSSKYTNIGNNSIIITGGLLDHDITNRVYALTLIGSSLNVKIVEMSPMKESRQNHNIIYLPKRNTVLVCGGQNTKSCEEYNLNQVNFEIESDSYNNGQWNSLPTLNQPRANASMFCVNDNYVYCVGGYDNKESKYIDGYEVLNMNEPSSVWKDFLFLKDLAISTFGVVNIDKNKIFLIGGFKGGKTYLNNGYELTLNKEGNEIIHVDKKENVSQKGVIFYSSQQFFKVGEIYFNFDFKHMPFVFDIETKTMKTLSN